MSELYVMSLANGEVFSQSFKGIRTVPLWTSLDATIHFRVHRPELAIYRPRLVDQRTLSARLKPLAEEGYRFIFPDLEPYNIELHRGPIKSFEDVCAMAGAASGLMPPPSGDHSASAVHSRI